MTGNGQWHRAVAAQIRAERAASGKTQREVIERSGIPKSTYLRLESGERRADADQLAQIVAVLGLRLSTFFQRVEDRVATTPTDALLDDASPSVRNHATQGRAAKGITDAPPQRVKRPRHSA